MRALLGLTTKLEGCAARLHLDPGVEGQHGNELADAVRVALEIAARSCGAFGAQYAASGGSDGVVAACQAVKRLLPMSRLACRALREFIAALLYLVLASPEGPEFRASLVRFMGLLCGSASVESLKSLNWLAESTLTPSGTLCPECACKNVAIQEALSLLRYFQQHLKTSRGCAGSHVEEGLVQLLLVTKSLVQGLHLPCYKAALTAGGGLWNWRELHVALVANGAGSAGTWQPLATSLSAAQQFHELSAAAEEWEAKVSEASAPARHVRREFPFASFPPALLPPHGMRAT